MKIKDMLTLLSPGLLFLIISLAGLGIGYGVLVGVTREQAVVEGQKKFERFVENVNNGTWQLTTDRWIEGMRCERAVAEAQRQVTASAIEIMRVFGWVGLAGLAFQIIVVFTFRAQQNKIGANVN